MIGKIPWVAILCFALVRSSPLGQRGKRSPPDQGTSSSQNDTDEIERFNNTTTGRLDTTWENAASSSRSVEEQSLCHDLVVLGLPLKTSSKNLRTFFKRIGPLARAEVIRDKFGRSKGFGFIKFDSYESHRRCLAQWNYKINGRWCHIEIPHKKQVVGNRLYVGGCTENVTRDDLFEYFSKFGQMTEISVPEPFRGFAFVAFSDQRIVQLLSDVQSHTIRGVLVYVVPYSREWARNSENQNSGNMYGCYRTVPTGNNIEQVPRSTVCVQCCEQTLNRNNLRDYFSNFGQVTSIYTPKPFRGVSFVTFKDATAERLLLRCSARHVIEGLTVYVSKATPKDIHATLNSFSSSSPTNMKMRECDEILPNDNSEQGVERIGWNDGAGAAVGIPVDQYSPPPIPTDRIVAVAESLLKFLYSPENHHGFPF